MKLLSLHIDKYKNLSGDYDFTTQDGYIALIGENGSGKSNLLEAISLIYHGIFDKKEIPFDYTIKYQIGDSIYERGKRIAKKDGEAIKASDIYHPSSIIACYSGEDRRLWTLAYKDYYNHYFNKAIGENYYTPKLLYIDKRCWEIALIALICAYDTPTVYTFLNNLGITDISDITISFQIDEERREMFKIHDALRWFNRVTHDGTIDINAKTLATTDTNPTSALAQKESKSKLVFQYLYLLSQPERKEGEPNRVQKLINSIDIKLKNVSFGDLSEGEKKLILIECITKVLGDNNSLLLLDEPDAHTHIARKKDLLEAIELFEGQTILTTHSPVFTALINKNNIFPITKGKFINAEQRDLIIKLANNSINYIDGACIISSKYLALTEGPGDINYITSAINACSKDNAKYKVLNKMSFVYIGGANQVQAFDDDILSKMYDTLESIIFIFDYDTDGRSGAKQVQELIDSGRNKIKILYYNRTYPINPDQDFYLEDMFDRRVYNVVQLPIINGEPTYAQLKKGATLAKSVKDKIAKFYDDGSLNENDYYSFKPFLDELIKLSNL